MTVVFVKVETLIWIVLEIVVVMRLTIVQALVMVMQKKMFVVTVMAQKQILLNAYKKALCLALVLLI
jgi:hypothetical protein